MGRNAPTNRYVPAVVESVSRAGAHAFSKRTEDRIRLLAGLGVEGDAHAGRTVQHRSRVARDPDQPNLRQVHLIHAELLDELRGHGFGVAPGELGENVTTRGIELLALPTGARLTLGDSAVVRGHRPPQSLRPARPLPARPDERRARPRRGRRAWSARPASWPSCSQAATCGPATPSPSTSRRHRTRRSSPSDRTREGFGASRRFGRVGPVDETRSALVFGARNLGRAIIETLRASGWDAAGVARSDRTLEGVTSLGALAVRADVTDPASVTGALERAAAAHGPPDLVVNAAAAYGGTRTGPFGGGPLAEAGADAFDSWASAPPRAAFSFLSATSRFLLAQGRPATIVQVTGGSSRRAMPGRGLWAAGAFGVRALTQAAALELREHGIQVVLLIVDAGIEPVSGAREGADVSALADPDEIAEAVRFLGEQGTRAATHELQVTPLAERWVP